MTGITDIDLWRMVVAYAYPIAVGLIVWRMHIPRENDILFGSIRMTIQLIVAGYILVWLFDQDAIWLVFVVIAVMEVFAVFTAFRRSNVTLTPGLRRIMSIALPVGTLISLTYFLLVVVGHGAWRDPRYVVPLAGMIIGNAMTGITLGVNRMVDGMHTERAAIESALMLGATPRVAARRVVRNAFDAAIMPTINSMATIGIVFLPGLMTGQILSGTGPLTAIKYQIAIMLAILGSVAFSVLLFVELAHNQFFNADAQLVDPEPANDTR